ncbi:MAG: hypothetical protein JWM57_2527 [Phycisphaerales bacterium]|nr:hypothetical protein [Phycisphaerales bacterium]
MPDARLAKLTAALRDKKLVRFTRPFEAGTVNGYVMDIGPRWFVLAVLSDHIRLNGYQCFRLSDVRNLQLPHPFEAFAAAAMKARGERRRKKPRVSTAGIAELLLSASKAFPLVTIHLEKVDPGTCQIGRVLQVTGGWLELQEIDPSAKWDADTTLHFLRDITRIDFGGEYEEALHLVGGRPPKR